MDNVVGLLFVEANEEAEDVDDPENGPLFSLVVFGSFPVDASVDGASICDVVKSPAMFVFDSLSLANETRVEPDRFDFGEPDTLAA